MSLAATSRSLSGAGACCKLKDSLRFIETICLLPFVVSYSRFNIVLPLCFNFVCVGNDI
jgi:hypothetical protein